MTCVQKQGVEISHLSPIRGVDITISIQLIMYALPAVPITQRFFLTPKFLMKVFLSKFFLHDAFHFGVRQISQKLILH